jgi:hypothetical protein
MENRQQLPNSGEQHLKLKTYVQHGPHQKSGVDSGAPEE